MKFNKGDMVEWETREFNEVIPRWDYQSDDGGSGKMWKGIVSFVDNISISVEYIDIEGDKRMWCWPNTDDARYSPDQWEKPGYLRRIGGSSDKGKIRLIDKGSYYATEEIK